MLRNSLVASAVLAVGASIGNGAIVINEVFSNPPGTDNGQEFIELRSTTDGIEAMTGLKLLGIDGDGTSAGVIDIVLDLGTFSTGSNGLFLWRDGSSVIMPAPHANTTLNVADFNPDIENGSQTFLIVSGFSGALAQDLDTNNDGTLDSLPWASVVDAIGLVENDGASNFGYGAQVGFTNFGPYTGFNADVLFRDSVSGTWLGTDLLGTNPGGPYTADPAADRSSFGASGTEQVTPGNENATVPEPGTMALMGLGAFGLLIRRRR